MKVLICEILPEMFNEIVMLQGETRRSKFIISVTYKEVVVKGMKNMVLSPKVETKGDFKVDAV